MTSGADPIVWFRAPDFQDGLLGLAEVGINANPDAVDPRINLTEALDNVEALLLEMDGCALASANFGLVPDDCHAKR
jgi:hypothetical protein